MRSLVETHPEQLPVVSLSSLLQNDVAEFAKLNHACTHWGFFQVRFKPPTLIHEHKVFDEMPE